MSLELDPLLFFERWCERSKDLTSPDDLMWELARFAGEELDFEDAVVYLYRTEKKVLIQKAVFGKKKKDQKAIVRPIEIPPGVGIVGAVAKSLESEIIPDTRLDQRYVVDDTIRLSEMSVPICFQNTLIGVFDSESSHANFFTADHLRIVSMVCQYFAVHYTLLKRNEDYLLITGLANESPFAVIRIDSHGNLIRHNNAALPLIKQWNLKSGSSNIPELAFSVGEGIDERTFISFVGDKYVKVWVRKKSTENFANIYASEVTQEIEEILALKRTD